MDLSFTGTAPGTAALETSSTGIAPCTPQALSVLEVHRKRAYCGSTDIGPRAFASVGADTSVNERRTALTKRF